LDSLNKQQIYGDVEVEYIFVNDGSTDNTLTVLKDFEIKDRRAVVIDQKNQGVSAARNAGLKIARGEYVFFLDGDDYLIDDASQILYTLSKDNKADILISNAYAVEDGQWDKKKEWNVCVGIDSGMYKTLEFARLVRSLPVSFKAYRRDMLVKQNLLFAEDLRVGEVYAFFLNAMTYSRQIAFTEKRIMNYVIRESGVMRTVNLERDGSIFNTMRHIDEYVRNQMPELLDYSSYKLGLYSIVNKFGIYNYVKKTSYTSEIGELLEKIRKDRTYRELQKYCICRDFGINKVTLFHLIMYYFPVFLTFRFLRINYRIKRYFVTKQ